MLRVEVCLCTFEQHDQSQILLKNCFVKALFVPKMGIGKDLSFDSTVGRKKIEAGKVLKVDALVNQCL